MPTLEEAAKEYSDDQYRLINNPATKKDIRREMLKTRLKELYIAEYRLKRANKTIKTVEESKRKTQETINEMLAYEEIRELFSKLRKEKKEEEERKKKEFALDSDEEDEFVSVEGIKYEVIVGDVVDLPTGKTIGKMEDGKVVFSKAGTKFHKKKVELSSKLQKQKKGKEEEEDSDSDSDDEEDEFVSVQGIKYLVVEEEVVDLKTGKIVGKMEDGKVVFSKSGTNLHKKRVDELKK